MTGMRRAYEEILRGHTSRVAETPASEGDELAWQARWFSGACGRNFTTVSGASVHIADFGQWNREAGPDFIRATIRIDGKEHHGAIEVDLDAAGWEQHGHATNAAYENVVLHVVVNRSAKRHFARTPSHRDVTQICLADHDASTPEWSGYAAARLGRCSAPLRDLPSGDLAELLAVAARRRLERKGAVLSSMIEARGTNAALYEATAVALGYKNNKLAFQLLAQRVPVADAASSRGEALLFGVAGFLEKPEPPVGAARAEVAELWANWWKLRGPRSNSILPRGAWNLAGIRPANHPLRRVAALHAMSRQWKSVSSALESASLPDLEKALTTIQHPFWSFHTTWSSPQRKAPLALIGADRIRDIYANISLPLALVAGKEPPWLDLPAGPANTSLRVVSARLFGGPLPRALPRRLFVHQGLLQIYGDFCLRDHEECAQCRFPSLINGLRA